MSSPSLQPRPDDAELLAGGDSLTRPSSRDEGSHYQAEAAMLSRENHVLKQRIRELGMCHLWLCRPP